MKEQIRKIQPRDTEEVLELIHKTTRHSYSRYYPQPAIDFFIQYQSKENVINDIEEGFAVVFTLDDQIVGTGMLVRRTIKRVFISPKFQGRGIGSKIMNVLEDRARDNGFEFLVLHAAIPAQQFYEGRNYKTLNSCQIPLDGKCTLDFYHMARMLKKTSSKSMVNLHNRRFTVVENSGPGAEVNEETIFTFFQNDELVVGYYEGGKIKEGELTGYIDGDRFVFHYIQVNCNGEKNSGNAYDTLKTGKNGKLQIIDTWKWETKAGSGKCIMEEM
ncbi:GNAT family N-acetyltransferase [Chitinispirillales bacterium ANBcel5]|uniref:GNAT family N-acetyltransferase n=1 Tax=Cellulosispirillum alkaliphilum TaxID=3039283 RepID=UPI002A59287E|nr:GNAT family N-acetyltransferase [Chitinispirillales bacterium ANBcel5]